jgi:BA14K-like protein
MKMSWMMIAICCVMAWTPVSAQQRDRGDRDGARRGGDTTIIHNYGDRRGGGRHYYRDRRPGYRYDSGRGWYDPSAIIGGAVGGWLWRQFTQPEPPPPPPPVVIVEREREPYRDVAYCVRRYKSYSVHTGQYLGYDGNYHYCP